MMSPNTVGNESQDQFTHQKNGGYKQTNGGSGFGMGHGLTTLAEQELILRPLPLLDISVPIQQEPGLLKAMNEAEGCPHIKVENWICQECNNKVSSFGCIFDSNKGKVHAYMKVIYENDFLEDFNNANAQGSGLTAGQDENPDNNGTNPVLQSSENNNIEADEGNNSGDHEIIYQQYQPSNVTELREYILFIICKKLKKQYMRTQSILGPGHVNHLSNKLINFLQELEKTKKKLLQKYSNDILLFDSVFECGNLLQAETVSPSEYQLYMQVDTNTRGHQQWFYFRVRNTKADRKYTFRIMNFTKQGLTTNSTTNNQAQPSSGINYNATIASNVGGGQGNPGQGIQQNQQTINANQKRSVTDHLQKIHFKSKQAGDTEWRVIDSDQLEFVKTSVQRKRKDILAAAADSDQEEINENEAEILADYQANSQKFLKQKSPKKRKPQYYYALQFDVSFSHANDSVYFAYSLPYSLTDMTEMILTKEQQIQFVPQQDEENKSQNDDGESSKDSEENKATQPIPNQIQGAQGGTPSWQENGCTIEIASKCIFYKREILARSICGLPLYQITISRDSKTYKRKPVVIITSRVHAAETPASYVFDGMYNFLCSNHSEAKFLRKFYTFILVPTLNPDGVVCGNYRSSISGVDLNRQWIQPDEEFQPEIFSIKQLLKTISDKERRQLWIYCDLHGHSKKKNSFFYGCNTAANGGFLSWTIVRLLPRIFAQKTHLFNYRDCRFKVEPYKLGTGRVVAWKQFMITHSFTLESSFYGYDFGEDEHRLFTPKDYAEVGQKFCQSIYELHYLWKSIRNELKLTNGWLKPRKLIEITGVPAAQILSEELQKKKKDEMKRKAIEHYEQFLKKFYNKSDGPQTTSNNAAANNNRRASKILAGQTNNPQLLFTPQVVPAQSQKPRVSVVQAGLVIQSQNKHAQDKSRNRDLTSGNTLGDRSQQIANSNGRLKLLAPVSHSNQDSQSISEEEKIYQLLQGLVKIQALIRGFLARKKYKLIISKIRIKKSLDKRIQSSNFTENEGNLEILHSNRAHSLHQSDLNAIQRDQSKQKMHIELGIQHGNQQNLMQGEDWRNYFQDNELDTAYQHVEVEREDDPDDTLSAGSSSNPSNDNFEMQEIYEQIYQVSNAKEVARRKKEANTRFIQDINDCDYIDQQSMFQILDGAFKGKRGQLVHKSINHLKNKAFNKRKIDQKNHPNGSSHVSPEKMIIRRPSLEQRELNFLKKSDNASPMQQYNNIEDINAYPLTAHQIIDPNKDKNLTSHQRLHTGNQQRSQYGPNHFYNHQNITSHQIKMFNQNVIVGSNNSGFGINGGLGGHHYGKKESIQQVIKDCFITKKIGNASSTQNNFFAQANQQSEGSRVHSLNNHKLNSHTQQSATGGPQKRQQNSSAKTSKNNNSGGGSAIINKTPAQKLQEQRDQIKQYFNNHQGSNQQPSQQHTGSGDEKYRAIMRDQAIPMQQQTHFGEGTQFPSPLTIGKLDNNSQYTVPSIQGLVITSASVNNNSTHDQAASSLFMKYVKSKLVRKIKTDQIPQQVTDKYIDIYKELIDREAQRKVEDQDFLRKHVQNPNNFGISFAAQSSITGPISSGVGNQLVASIGPTAQQQRIKQQTRSEQKSRQKNSTRGIMHPSQHPIHHTSRKQHLDSGKPSHSYGFNQHQQYVPTNFSIKYDEMGARNNMNMTFSQNYGVRQSGELSRQNQQFGVNASQQNHNRIQDIEQLIQAEAKIQSFSEMTDSMKLPLINNFALTSDYKKKSRESLLDNPNGTSSSLNAQQLRQVAIPQKNIEEPSHIDMPLTNSNLVQQQAMLLPLGGTTNNGQPGGISMYSINNAQVIKESIEIASPLPKQNTGRRHIIAATQLQINKDRNNQMGVISDQSIDSSIDEEMLDKIKNIYTEMRKNNGTMIAGAAPSQYYGLGNGINAQGQQTTSNVYYPLANGAYSRCTGNQLSAAKNVGGSYQISRALQQRQRVSGHSKEGSGGAALQGNHSVEGYTHAQEISKSYFNQNSQIQQPQQIRAGNSSQIMVGTNNNNIGKNLPEAVGVTSLGVGGPSLQQKQIFVQQKQSVQQNTVQNVNANQLSMLMQPQQQTQQQQQQPSSISNSINVNANYNQSASPQRRKQTY